jgi:hypothetical protein
MLPIEDKRILLQEELDSKKTSYERNILGQFSTPTFLAHEILAHSKKLMSDRKKIKFFDPAIGTGSFYSALLANFPKERIQRAEGYEVDHHYGNPSIEFWKDFDLKIKLTDFTLENPNKENLSNLIICNPPYVRHHHLNSKMKEQLRYLSRRVTGIDLNGLTGLYGYFLLISHMWMEEGGIAGWLIPSEFMDVNYGNQIKQYLLDKVKLIHIHRFDPDEVQFNDALVSSTVVWLKKIKPPKSYEVEFSFGGTLNHPKISKDISTKILRKEPKWTRFPILEERQLSKEPKLSDFFSIKRGIATGDNNFFILNREQIEKLNLPIQYFRPVLPSPRYLKVDIIDSDQEGNPLIAPHLFLLDCKLPENEVKKKYPTLWKYIEKGIELGIPEKYLCKHRSLWYSQENRDSTPFICTYMGRKKNKNGNNRPFRFILNHSKATATNVYLMLYPTKLLNIALTNNPSLSQSIWSSLNNISLDILLEEGRVYGGGLHKLEPKELAKVPASTIMNFIPKEIKPARTYSQLSLF